MLARQFSRLNVRTFSTAKPVRAAVPRKPSTSGTTSADLHELPQSVKSAGVPSQPPPSSQSVAPSGNSISPEDISSRPAAPGPSAPHINPQVAAPDTVFRGAVPRGDHTAIATAAANWTTSFAGMSERPFGSKPAEVLGEKIDPQDVEIKPGEWRLDEASSLSLIGLERENEKDV